VEEWEDGRMGGWKNGRVEGWSDRSFGPLARRKMGRHGGRPSHEKTNIGENAQGFAAYGPNPNPVAADLQTARRERPPRRCGPTSPAQTARLCPSSYSTIGSRGERSGSLTNAATRESVSSNIDFWPGGLRSVAPGWCAGNSAGRKGYVPRKPGSERLQRLRGTAALQA